MKYKFKETQLENHCIGIREIEIGFEHLVNELGNEVGMKWAASVAMPDSY